MKKQEQSIADQRIKDYREGYKDGYKDGLRDGERIEQEYNKKLELKKNSIKDVSDYIR